jgi:hypothetical protein
VVSPPRTTEPDVVIISSHQRRAITKDVRDEDSDHPERRGADLHQRLYPRPGERESESW